MFPRLDPEMYPIDDDQQFFLEAAAGDQGACWCRAPGFNWPHPDHFRIVFLPHEDDLREAIGRLASFLEQYRKRHGTERSLIGTAAIALAACFERCMPLTSAAAPFDW